MGTGAKSLCGPYENHVKFASRFPTGKWEDWSILSTDFCLPLAEALCHSSGLPWCMTSFYGARKIPQ